MSLVRLKILPVLSLILILLLTSCNEESGPQGKVKLLNFSDNKVFYINEPSELKGVVEGDVSKVTVQLSSTGEPELEVDINASGEFSYSTDNFSSGYNQVILFKGYYNDGSPANTVSMSFNVIEKPTLVVDLDPDLNGKIDFPTGVDLELAIQFSQSIKSIRVEVGNKIIAEEVASATIPVHFRYPVEEGVLKIIGLGNEGLELITQKYTVSLIGDGEVDERFRYDFEAITSDRISRRMSLWATYYYLPQVFEQPGGDMLRDMGGDPLGPELSRKDWCNAAMEGSIYVKDGNGSGVTYNYAGTQSSNQVDCSRYFSHRLGRTKFRIANGEYGDGVKSYKLIPYRTIAVDRRNIAYGKIVYIEKARGTAIELPNGSTVLHDGYFFAGDTGGAIKGSHIDVYIGLAKKNPFSWVRSSSRGKFDAVIVDDVEIEDILTRLHTN